MEGIIIRIGILTAGLLLFLISFLMHSRKKIAVNFAVIWGLLGIVLMLVGAVPVLSEWTNIVAPGTGFAFFCVGAIILFTEVQTGVIISQLSLKNRELAMQVALLNQENERIMTELDEVSKTVEEAADARPERSL